DTIAFTSQSQTGIWIRRLNALDAVKLPGTEGAMGLFWSPDSRSIAFHTGGRLNRIELAGGAPQILCDMTDNTAGAWSSSGVILFRKSGVFYRVSQSGGEPVRVT